MLPVTLSSARLPDPPAPPIVQATLSIGHFHTAGQTILALSASRNIAVLSIV